ncbi:M56 family metallopeptidase [Mangrovimonas futianensis]|uniref:M56 family metallopeptidase n=1 Tax=Mangrovimonas futianensis TaxID=2895523 RepID=UPI001E610038|nr:M56 family metallopeptidase [Mangrovimonas futianensis]MCF1420424.1 M56 family metallopeptidase [Mangrovimonas futianensis]
MMIHYLIQLLAYQLLFLLVYDLFLKKETFFNWNRVYLLVTSALSFVIPLIKIESFKEVVPQTYIWSLPKLNIDTQGPIILDEVILQGTTNNVNPLWYLYAILILGGVLSLLYFLYRIYTISRLIKTHKMDKGTVYHVVEIPNSTTAFSFFNFVFLGANIHETERGAIVDHEKVHVVQRHTYDLIFFELLRIPLWFNPLIYMYQSRMSDLHEFIADQQAVKQNKKQYYQNLLSQVFETQNVSFINTFFKKSLIKKRLVMLQKSKSNQIQLFKYALLIPVVMGMLIYSSCADDTSSEAAENNLDLNQYTYTLGMGEELVGEKKAIHDRFESFLIGNKEYVAWGEIASNSDQVTYSVHHKDETIPAGFSKMEVNTPQGSYALLMNLPKDRPGSSKNLMSQIDAVKEQIEIEGHISEEGEKGLEFLLKMLTLEDKPNQQLIKDVQTYMSASPKNELHQRISDLFEAIQVKGDMTVEEDLALKTLLTLVSEEGLDGPFYEEIKDRIEIPFAVLDQVPAFPNSGPFDSEEEKKKAFSQEISRFVAMNFNTNLASELGLTGVQKISVFFKIGVDGNITEVKARAPKPELEAEAIRVVKMLPTFIPGEHQGKKVTVPYYLPIKFQVSQ